MSDHGDSNNYWARYAAGRLNRRRALGVGAAGLTAFGLAACGSSNKNNNTNTNSASNSNAAAPAASASAAAATKPAGSPVAGASPVAGGAPAASAATAPGYDPKLKTGGRIQYYMVVNPPLDPFENSTYSAQYVAGFAYSRLFKFNSGPDPKISLSRQPIGDLVTSYEVTPDGLTYTMKLQPNAMFHPPLSRPLTSADVLATWQRFTTDTKNVNSGVFASIVDSLTAPDATTIVFKLKQPYAPFLNKLANPQYLWIMSAEATTGKIDPSQQMIGTGPWIFDTKSATSIAWKKNPNYFIKGLPYADGVDINIIPDTATQEAQLAAGALDVLLVPVSDVDSMKKQVPKANVAQYTGNLLAFLFFTNVSDPNSAFKDPRMRQAASLALDRPGLLSLIYGGKGDWDNLINPGLGNWWLDPQGKDIGDPGKYFKKDTAQAKQLLTAAGHDKTQFKFIYPNNAYGDVYNQASDAVRGMLSDAGFQLSVVTVDYLKDYINNGQGIFFKGAPADSIVHALQTPFTDPDDYLFNMLSPKSMRNHESVNDADLTAVITAQQIELDDAKRHQLVYKAQQMQDAQMYYAPTVNGATFAFSQPWVQNFFVADDYGFGTEQLMYVSLNK